DRVDRVLVADLDDVADHVAGHRRAIDLDLERGTVEGLPGLVQLHDVRHARHDARPLGMRRMSPGARANGSSILLVSAICRQLRSSPYSRNAMPVIVSASRTTVAFVRSADSSPSSRSCSSSGLYSLRSTVSRARSGVPSGANRVNCWRTFVTTHRN